MIIFVVLGLSSKEGMHDTGELTIHHTLQKASHQGPPKAIGWVTQRQVRYPPSGVQLAEVTTFTELELISVPLQFTASRARGRRGGARKGRRVSTNVESQGRKRGHDITITEQDPKAMHMSKRCLQLEDEDPDPMSVETTEP
ncbi:hypothetical protein Salat_2664500 [Sesamum alatum]|uniref:Uncharacterized protein n=1 Tax=Sesamum alatum TaxID=300844 RepID=A0AAE1XPG5_9LAMI|nr:hypothetical protein Salat_2664500 [Sesamum alatum]